MSNKLPTAEEFLENYRFKAGEHIGNRDFDTMVQYAKDFAKLHVEAATERFVKMTNGNISNVYPLETIK